jgi:hypothetical protein
VATTVPEAGAYQFAEPEPGCNFVMPPSWRGRNPLLDQAVTIRPDAAPFDIQDLQALVQRRQPARTGEDHAR